MRYKERVLGSKGLRKRWKTCVSYTNEYLGEILGKLYKDQNFKESAKITVSIIAVVLYMRVSVFLLMATLHLIRVVCISQNTDVVSILLMII